MGYRLLWSGVECSWRQGETALGGGEEEEETGRVYFELKWIWELLSRPAHWIPPLLIGCASLPDGLMFRASRSLPGYDVVVRITPHRAGIGLQYAVGKVSLDLSVMCTFILHVTFTLLRLILILCISFHPVFVFCVWLI